MYCKHNLSLEKTHPTFKWNVAKVPQVLRRRWVSSGFCNRIELISSFAGATKLVTKLKRQTIFAQQILLSQTMHRANETEPVFPHAKNEIIAIHVPK